MIDLLSLKAVNVRALGDVEIHPLTDGGVTALNGPNGSGKSSLLAVMLWVLYGVTPDGVPIPAMRRQRSTGECFGRVRFMHDQQTVEVVRGLKGVKDATYVTITVDGTTQAFGKVRAAEAWVQERLGLDADGFLTAFVIRQKELDGIVRARPADRRRLIERLAGIERMSKAVKSAREEESDARRRLEVLPGSSEDLATAQRALADAQAAAVSAWEAFEAAQATAAADEEQRASAADVAADVLARARAHAQAQAAAREATTQVTVARERHAHASQNAQRLREQAVGGSSTDLAAAREAAQVAQDAWLSNRQASDRVARATDTARTEAEREAAARTHLQRLRSTADRAASQVEAAQRALDATPADLAPQHRAAQARVSALVEQRGGLRSEHTRLTASIAALKATAAPECPTCATSLSDPAALLVTLEQAVARVMEQGTRVASEHKVAAEAETALSGRLEEATSTAQTLRHARERADTAREAADQAAAEVATAQERARAAAAAATTANEQAAEARAAAPGIRQALDAASTALRQAESAAEALAQVPAAEETALQAQARVQETEEVARAAAEAVSLTAVDEQEYLRVQAEAARTEAAARASREAQQRTEADHRVAQETARHAEHRRDAERTKVAARAQALALLERRTAAREALDDFRKDRIARVAPELSEVATDFVAKMTDGKFVAVELDEEFTPVVTSATGDQRPVSWLSGGEESSVALALRVAIGELIAGQRGGLLWMDEPFTAQDAVRRPAMMASVRDLPGRQVITINHASEATDMVDLVIDVVPDEENGSTVVVSTDRGAVTEAALDAVDAVEESEEAAAATSPGVGEPVPA